jgi:subtilisin family serine protease
MPRIPVLVEVKKKEPEAFALHAAARETETESVKFAESLLKKLSGLSLEVMGTEPPVPMFSQELVESEHGLRAFSSSEESPDIPSETFVVSCEIDSQKLEELSAKPGIQVWPNSELAYHARSHTQCHCGGSADRQRSRVAGRSPRTASSVGSLFDLARSAGTHVDCSPYRPAVEIEDIRQLLGVQSIWSDGFRGQNIVVGIVDEGVNGVEYPVIGGFSRPNAQRPGTAPIGSHGSMCAADILVAAPAAKLYDYPFLGIPNSGGALTMFQEALNQRRLDGTPHLLNNSYGFMAVPSATANPRHEIHDMNHPFNRKVREVIASGCSCCFSAGNCGGNCPDGRCHTSGIGSGKSIHAANSLEDVITVAAVNSRHERIGYSSQGPGMFASQKPDLSGYSHFFGNFGPGRPAGGDESDYDSGTSAACPVVSGAVALLLSAFPTMTPPQLKQALIQGCINIGVPGWDSDTGFGIINLAASYSLLRRPTP